MALKVISYKDARPRMKAGDVIAFSGKSHFSELIKFSTMSPVSHIGTILKTQVSEKIQVNQIIESATINDIAGVSITRFSDRLSETGLMLWWLPLNKNKPFDQEKFYEFLFDKAEKKVKYDLPQALKAGFDLFDKLPFGMSRASYNTEDLTKLFCSELVAAGLERAGTIPDINCSEVTPIDLCRWNIYEEDYYILEETIPKNEKPKPIRRFNTQDPEIWKEE